MYMQICNVRIEDILYVFFLKKILNTRKSINLCIVSTARNIIRSGHSLSLDLDLLEICND
ncbi:BnaC05g43830D [Brassica napus]|uniref:(rape) hypothetical protein n=1 Tax=Brassica napus TaxID=3708 RepID=A0A078GRD9_BRANA|nr:unnamed protein product [Brassica napus]CDY27981.1 BnaC05g43830D [Brassica napus]